MKNEFLEKLADLCDEYKASFNYTIDDDGIHIEIDGEEIFKGFMYDPGTLANNLRAESKKI